MPNGGHPVSSDAAVSLQRHPLSSDAEATLQHVTRWRPRLALIESVLGCSKKAPGNEQSHIQRFLRAPTTHIHHQAGDQARFKNPGPGVGKRHDGTEPRWVCCRLPHRHVLSCAPGQAAPTVAVFTHTSGHVGPGRLRPASGMAGIGTDARHDATPGPYPTTPYPSHHP
jgi:hypothetical protein